MLLNQINDYGFGVLNSHKLLYPLYSIILLVTHTIPRLYLAHTHTAYLWL